MADTERFGALSLTRVAPIARVSVLPMPGRVAAASRAVEGVLGQPLPPAGRFVAAGAGRILWMGVAHWMVEGAEMAPLAAALGPAALVSDQSGGWAAWRLSGAGARAALARAVPIDLRPAAFAPGQVARTEIAHVAGAIVAEPEGVTLMVPSSYAAWFEDALAQRLRAFAAEAALPD